ncbi:hypothetical protein AKJ49_00385 [candidate division MSBL1 archaeon SCGC-AAA382A03]|uniref:[dimethylamine--corrinoid protein] Co-methyltransferase n=1 Tax=candidate division MSBL1 archaeon SCGC-AAA382A03 TaxID=1698278 RepID=A0A133VGR5_9EURY|nr:hypothetical protein AKJ49_00385 [candidate division MSBL1 archaeon SCGC-AAA382A03]
MDVTYRMAAGMGGLRTSGDLVARTQLDKKMQIDEGKKYVAEKLGIDVTDLSDEIAMRKAREENGIGLPIATPGKPKGFAAKKNIKELFDFDIRSIEALT